MSAHEMLYSRILSDIHRQNVTVDDFRRPKLRISLEHVARSRRETIEALGDEGDAAPALALFSAVVSTHAQAYGGGSLRWTEDMLGIDLVCRHPKWARDPFWRYVLYGV